MNEEDKEEKSTQDKQMRQPKPNTPTNTVIDPELDIRSEKFNPLKALLSPNTIIPYPDEKIYDNIAAFEAKLRKQTLKTTDDNVKKKENPFKRTSQASTSTATDEQQFDELLTTRRFLPHQGEFDSV